MKSWLLKYSPHHYRQHWQQLKSYQKIGVVIVVILFLYFIWQAIATPKHRTPVVLVDTAVVGLQDVPVTIKSIGTVESAHAVTIMPQVTGQLAKIAVEPGQHVDSGQLLFEINSDTVNAVLKQNQAILQRDQAQLSYLEANAKRYANLVRLEYVTRDQYEQTKASAAAQIALVEADKEQVKQSQIDLNHTHISAAVSGKLGNYTVRVGDLMVANTTVMATINQLSPVWIDFTVPQQQLSAIQQANKSQALIVKIYSEDDEQQELAQARLFFIDNSVNTATGTILLKAVADNKDYRLWPGQMINAKMILETEKNVIVIPLQAVQFDNDGSFVYVLIDHKAVIQRIEIARQFDQTAVVKSGLKPGQFVLTTIPPNLQDGTTVTLKKDADSEK